MRAQKIIACRASLFWIASACLLSGCGGQTTSETAADRGAQVRVVGKPVSVTLRASASTANRGDTIELSVHFQIAAGWDIRTLDSQPAISATKLKLQLPEGFELQGDWQSPEPVRSSAEDGHRAHGNEAVLKRTVLVTPSAKIGLGRIGCEVSYQACNREVCLQPAALELGIPVVIEGVRRQ